MFRSILIRQNLKKLSIYQPVRLLRDYNGKFNKLIDHQDLKKKNNLFDEWLDKKDEKPDLNKLKSTAYNLNQDLDYENLKEKIASSNDFNKTATTNYEEEEDDDYDNKLDASLEDDYYESNEIIFKKSDLANNLNDCEKKRIIDEYTLKLESCENITSLLNTIQPEIRDLTPLHLEFIFNQINKFCFKSKKIAPHNAGYKEFMEIIQTSTTFKRLLEQTKESIEELNPSALVIIYKTMCLINYDPQSRLVKLIIDFLKLKKSSLELNELTDCLSTINFYSKNPFASHLFDSLNRNLWYIAKNKISNNEYNYNDVDTVVYLIDLFSRFDLNDRKLEDDHFEIVTNLLNPLDSKGIHFEFKQSVKLLKSLKKIKFIFKRHYKSNLPKIYYDIINKANIKIYEDLSLDLENQKENCDFYIYEIHSKQDPHYFNLDFMYNYKILSILSSNLVNNFNRNNEYWILNLVMNFSKNYMYDEKLLESLYNHIINDEKFRYTLDRFAIFALFSRHRLPFVDHKLFAKLLFDYSRKCEKSISYRTNRLRLLTELILNDINDSSLIKYLLKTIDDLNPSIYRKSTFSLFKNYCLAKVYLPMFSNYEPNLRITLERRLKKILNYINIVYERPKIDDHYFNLNNKLQKGAYLTNGIYLNVFTIYDKSTNNLVPLNEFTDYFNKIDKIPLNDNQELIVFVESERLRGNIPNYDTNYHFKLKMVLNNLNIKTINVYKDEFRDLNMAERTDFFVQKALDSYK